MKNQSKIVSFFALVIFIVLVFLGYNSKMKMDKNSDLGQDTPSITDYSN